MTIREVEASRDRTYVARWGDNHRVTQLVCQKTQPIQSPGFGERFATNEAHAIGRRRLTMINTTTRAIRVLFVDDDQSTRDGYTAYLTGRGYDVLTAANGHEALTLAAGWSADVVILDLGLPDIDGWEVSRQLKAGRRTAAVPIIALTGSGLPHERVSAMRAGCERHLTKPCKPTDLVDAIQRCLAALT